MSRILVIDDETDVNRSICRNLRKLGHETIAVYDGKAVVEILGNSGLIDMAILDVELPGLNGFELLPLLKERGISAVFLTAEDSISTKLQGLIRGAEDYIIKPFEMPELIVRIQKVLSRAGKLKTVIKADNITINTSSHSVKKNNKTISLTPIEYDLLLELIRNKNKTLSREKLLSDVWGIFYDGGTRTVDVHIAQLRKKTELHIETVTKIGYRLDIEGRTSK